MNCTRLHDWLQGSPGSPAAFPADHLRDCTDCQELAARHERAKVLLRQLAQDEAPPWPGLATLRTRARARTRARRLGWIAFGLPMAAGLAVALRLLMPSAAPEGTVRMTAPTEETRPETGGNLAVVAGTVLDAQAGQEIQTGDSDATLARRGTGVVRLAARSRLRVEVYSEDATSLRLEDGLLEARVEHRAPGQSFEIRTEYATVRVVGTRFTVSHHPGADTEVRVEEGEVVVDAPGGGRLARIPAGGAARFESSDSTVPMSAQMPDPGLPGDACAMVEAPRNSEPSLLHRAIAASRPLSQPAVADLLAMAQDLLSAGHGQQALDLLATAADLPPAQKSRALTISGDAHRAAGKPEDALRAYEQAVQSWSGTPPETLLLDLSLVLDELGRSSEAASVWQRYLAAWPNGRFVGQALDGLAHADEAAGRFDEARMRINRLLDQAPSAPEAMPAFVRIGRVLVDRGDLEGAARWFQSRLDSPGTALAETALVGLMRVRLQEGRAEEVRNLAAEHGRRFPDALRNSEVRRLVEALAPPVQPAM
jgi:tetratricopeptide (TPR) repeat protein